MLYTYQTVARTVYGHGAASQLGAEVGRLGLGRAYLVMDKGILKNDVHAPIAEALAAAGVATDIFSDVELDPSPASIERAATGLKSFKADVIIGIGGGSALDSAKALSLLAAHPGPLEQYFGMHRVPGPCMPTILVPTTAGTGSEMTSISVLADLATDSKKGIVSKHLYAKTIVLDPDLTLSLPPLYTAYTGLDAFVHALESYVNLSATPFTEGHALQAMGMIAGNLRKAYANGLNREARAQMLYASSIAGMGFSNTQNGVIHALGMAVPAKYHLPHGLLMAAIAPMGIGFNCIAAPEKYARIAGILGCDTRGLSASEQARRAVRGFTSLLRDVNVKPGLQPYGVKREDLRGIAERAAASARLMDNNPRQGNADQLETLLEEHY
ncbi:MAG: iron-containing alcohol dehydrogenase [Desulfovibrio sp.]|nr:iron-containing alcohol dehydrogenase [Desulfovibrio sp.]